MSVGTDQLGLMQAIANAITGWQATARGLTPNPVTIIAMTVDMPPADETNYVTFTWDETKGRFSFATANGTAPPQ